ncbi:helix-turn-helix transcriptional regulator [Deinococcus yunweiensis]|uniref:helix-turn-helix transcriptional regulator n=1 Tax=Deinococcus yunweiensis TaxID=367282 RepID=UPI00398F2B73
MSVLSSEWLRALRFQQGLRQVDLSNRTAALHGRVTQATVSRLETGRHRPSDLNSAQVAALCAVLGVTPEEWAANTAEVDGSTGDVGVTPRRRYRPPAQDSL